MKKYSQIFVKKKKKKKKKTFTFSFILSCEIERFSSQYSPFGVECMQYEYKQSCGLCKLSKDVQSSEKSPSVAVC